MSLPPIESGQKVSLIPNLGIHPSPLAKPLQIPDVLIMDSSFQLSEIWEQVTSFFKKLWESICSCFPGKSNPTVLSNTMPLLIYPILQLHRIINPNKLFVYEQLLQGRSLDFNHVAVTKFSLANPRTMESSPLFTATRPQVTTVGGPFRYDAMTADTIHWTANFADTNLFGYCEGPLLAQDELQVLEHPALAHVKNALPGNLRTLQLYDAVLFQNVPRLGALDTTTPLANNQSLYGNYFATASQAEILSRLTRFVAPTLSNIFAFAAPRAPLGMAGQPYQRKDLETLFFTAYNAFRGIKAESAGKRVVAHTGNWGAGAFGNDAKTVNLLQIAAARYAGIDEIRMHPMSQQSQLQAAMQLLDQIERQFPQMTIGGFLDHLTENASYYLLLYGQSNGT